MSAYHFLSENIWYFYCALVVISLIAGSFLNVVIARLPVMMQRKWRQECCLLLQQKDPLAEGSSAPFNLLVPGSHCPHCAVPVRPVDNIPVVSFLFLKGRCRGCGGGISLRYPLIELTAAVLGLIVGMRYGLSWQTVVALAFSWSLLCLALIDWEHMLLPDSISLPLLWAGLLVNMFGLFTDLYSSLTGAMLGYVILWSTYMLFRTLTGKEGMGYGDFKLLAALGAWLGWQLLPFLLLFSALSACVVGLLQIFLSGGGRDTPIPFGPHLALAGFSGLVWGSESVLLPWW